MIYLDLQCFTELHRASQHLHRLPREARSLSFTASHPIYRCEAVKLELAEPREAVRDE